MCGYEPTGVVLSLIESLVNTERNCFSVMPRNGKRLKRFLNSSNGILTIIAKDSEKEGVERERERERERENGNHENFTATYTPEFTAPHLIMVFIRFSLFLFYLIYFYCLSFDHSVQLVSKGQRRRLLLGHFFTKRRRREEDNGMREDLVGIQVASLKHQVPYSPQSPYQKHIVSYTPLV